MDLFPIIGRIYKIVLIIRVITLTLLLAFSCSSNDDPVVNGFKIGDKFYPTPYGSYAKSGGTNDYEFSFFDKQLVKNLAGSYELVGLENNMLNGFVMSDLTLKSSNEFVGSYFFDDTESLPSGIDGFSYAAEQEFDSDGNTINLPTPSKVVDGSARIITQKGNAFKIEYQASFDNGVVILGSFDGQLLFRE